MFEVYVELFAASCSGSPSAGVQEGEPEPFLTEIIREL